MLNIFNFSFVINLPSNCIIVKLEKIEEEIKTGATAIARELGGSLEYAGPFDPAKILKSVEDLKGRFPRTWVQIICVLFMSASLIGYTNSKTKQLRVKNPALLRSALIASKWSLGKSDSAITVGQVESVLPRVKIAVLQGMSGLKARNPLVGKHATFRLYPYCTEWGFAFLKDGPTLWAWAEAMKAKSMKITAETKKFSDCLITFNRHVDLVGTAAQEELPDLPEGVSAAHAGYDAIVEGIKEKSKSTAPATTIASTRSKML